MSTTTKIARRILACLAPMTGTRSSGVVTASATSDPVTIPKGAIGAPVVDGSIDYSRLFWVTAETVAGAAGAAVPVRSLLGGAAQNLAGSASLRWFPALSGLEPLSPFSTNPSGGADGDVKQTAIYETLSSDVARDLFSGKLGRFPAMVLAWERSDRAVRAGTGVARQVERWTLYVVVSRVDAAERRGAEGLALLDRAEELLVDRSTVDGALRVASPAVEITARGRRAIASTSYVYTLSFGTPRGVQRDDSAALADASPWLVSDVDVLVAPDPEDGLSVAHVLADMTPADPPPPDP